MKFGFKLDFLPILILLIGLGPILITILSPRDISMGEGDLFEVVQLNQTAVTASRALTAIILSLCVFKILSVVKNGRVPSGGSGILSYYLLFFLSTTLITAVVGRGSFDIGSLYVPFVFAAAYVARPVPIVQLFSLGKFVLLIYMYGSLLAAALVPGWAVMGTYESLLPGIDTRLFGISGHANQLGPFAAAYLVMEFLNPKRSKLRLINLAAVLVVFIWAQSKTAWGYVLLAALYFAFFKIKRALFSQSNSRRYFRKITLYGFVIAVGVVLFVMGLKLINGTQASPTGGVETLTGRTTIWAITLKAWAVNPIFGYGLSLWDKDFRAQYGMFNVGHAHNQFINTLGASGLIGLFGLLIYLAALFKRAIKVAAVNPVALALFYLIVVDCITETPLKNSGILGGLFFLHLLLFTQLRTVK